MYMILIDVILNHRMTNRNYKIKINYKSKMKMNYKIEMKKPKIQTIMLINRLIEVNKVRNNRFALDIKKINKQINKNVFKMVL